MIKKFLLLISFFTISCTPNNIQSEIEIPLSRQNETNNQIIELEKGDIVQLNGNVKFTDGKVTNDVFWESLSPDIIGVENNGKITAIKEGTATVKIISNQDKSKFSTIEIKVIPVIEKGIRINTGTSEQFLKDLDPTLFKQDEKKINPNSLSATPIPEITYPKTTLNVYLYSPNNNFIDDASVTVKSLDKSRIFEEKLNSISGYANFKNVPLDTLVSIKVEKEGFNTKERIEVIKKVSEERIDFGGSEENEVYSIQQEPEINKVLVNNISINNFNSSNISNIILPTGTETPNIVINNTNLSITLNFSKPINTVSFENSLEIKSQLTKNNPNGFILNKSTNNLFFSWGTENKSVSISSNILFDDLRKIIYVMSLKNTFSDKTGINSLQNKAININNLKKINNIVLSFEK